MTKTSLLGRTTSLQYLLQEAALFLGLSFLLILNGTTRDLINPDLQKGLAILLSICVLAWIAAGQRSATPAGRALLVWVGVYVVVAVFSIDPRRSLSQMALMSISVFLFALAADLAARGWPRELFTKALLMVGSVIILLGLLEASLWYARWLQASPGQWIPGVLYRPGSANVIAMFLNLMLMLAISRLLVTREWAGRIALLALIAPALFLLYLTSSRGGWLGAAAGFAALGGLALFTRLLEWRKGWVFLRSRPLLLTGLVVVGLTAAGAVGTLLYQRTIHPTHAPVAGARQEYWPPALDAFRRSPLVGTGSFTYSNAFIRYNSVPPKDLYIHSHGTYFNLLGEMGILGAAGMVFLVGSILRILWRQLKRSSGADLGVVIGAFAAVAAIGAHSLFDCFHTEPIGLWALCVVLGASAGRSEPAPRLGRVQNGWTLVFILALWADIWMAAPLHQGVELANSGRWAEAATAFDSAVTRDPASVIARQQHALANAVLANQGVSGTLEAAVSDLEEVTQREPGWALNHANLGALYLAQERPAEARQALEEAMRRAPRCGLCALNLGIACEAAGDESAAQQAYTAALDLGQPADAYFWRSSPVRQAAQTVWLQENPSLPLEESELKAELERDASSARTYLTLAAILLEENRAQEAAEMIAKGSLAHFGSALTGIERDWLSAELLARQGDLEQAAQQGQQVFFTYRLHGPHGPGSLGNLAYAPLMFRRPAMALELAPQLTYIPLPDMWGQRAEKLAGWLEQAGSGAQAGQVWQDLRSDIPDYPAR